jgi:hypothetical protein
MFRNTKLRMTRLRTVNSEIYTLSFHGDHQIQILKSHCREHPLLRHTAIS